MTEQMLTELSTYLQQNPQELLPLAAVIIVSLALLRWVFIVVVNVVGWVGHYTNER